MKLKNPFNVESFAKQIFPGAMPKIIRIGDGDEGGVIFYGFEKFYPREFGIFVPNGIDATIAFQKPFDDYFTYTIYDRANELARQLGVPVRAGLLKRRFECVSGARVKTSFPSWFPINSSIHVYRFDELVPTYRSVCLLCRMSAKNLSLEDKLYIYEVCSSLDFIELCADANETEYLYWTMDIGAFFNDRSEFIASAISYFS